MNNYMNTNEMVENIIQNSMINNTTTGIANGYGLKKQTAQKSRNGPQGQVKTTASIGYN